MAPGSRNRYRRSSPTSISASDERRWRYWTSVADERPVPLSRAAKRIGPFSRSSDRIVLCPRTRNAEIRVRSSVENAPAENHRAKRPLRCGATRSCSSRFSRWYRTERRERPSRRGSSRRCNPGWAATRARTRSREVCTDSPMRPPRRIQERRGEQRDRNQIRQEADRLLERVIDDDHGMDRHRHGEPDFQDGEGEEREQEPRRSGLPVCLANGEQRDDHQDRARDFPQEVHRATQSAGRSCAAFRLSPSSNNPLDLCQKRHTGGLCLFPRNSMQRSVRVLAFVLVIGLVTALPLAVRPASAHRLVSVGEYVLTVGWKVEPAVAGYVTGLDLVIQHRLLNGTPVS